MVVFGVGSNEVPSVQAVEMKLAHAKLNEICQAWEKVESYVFPLPDPSCYGNLSQKIEPA